MFQFRNGSLQVESVPLESIAREYGTPCYVYSRAALCIAGRARPRSWQTVPRRT